ncbi:MAG: hypothetical protein LBS57_08525 [Treponema sp.]|nr:hypothetical protein [Treponema sp.]
MMEKRQEFELRFNDKIERGVRRKEERYSTNAHVRLLEDKLLLKNISLHGGQIKGDDFIDVIPNGKYTIAVMPEKESNIDKFDVEILSKWVKIKKSGTESGFIIILPPGSKIVEEYIEYLKKLTNAKK